jgi:hypothetical protein
MVLLWYDTNLTPQRAYYLTRANLGNIILNWNGQDVVNADAEILNQLDNVYGGVSEFSASAGSTTNASVFIPCGLWFDSQNVYDIGENDNVYLKLDFSDLASASNVDSGTINVYGKNKTGVMSYLHNITSRPVVASGASTLADTYKINNISQIYLKDPATLLSNVQFSKDKETIVDASPGVLISYSDYVHQLETTNTTLRLTLQNQGTYAKRLELIFLTSLHFQARELNICILVFLISRLLKRFNREWLRNEKSRPLLNLCKGI